MLYNVDDTCTATAKVQRHCHYERRPVSFSPNQCKLGADFYGLLDARKGKNWIGHLPPVVTDPMTYLYKRGIHNPQSKALRLLHASSFG